MRSRQKKGSSKSSTGNSRLLRAILCFLLFLPASLFASPSSSATNDRLAPSGETRSQVITGELSGYVWLDESSDRVFDEDETPLHGWTLQVIDRDDILYSNAVVNTDGSFHIEDITAGSPFTLRLLHSESNVVVSEINHLILEPGSKLQGQNFPVEPAGVVYDSESRQVLSGAILQFTDAQGQLLPDRCLLSGQQNQMTGSDGRYFLGLQFGADAACADGSTTVNISVNTHPAGYRDSVVLPPIAGSLDLSGSLVACHRNTLLDDHCHVQTQSPAPAINDPVTYYRSIVVSRDDQSIANNHIPLDVTGDESSIWLRKMAARTAVFAGDIVQYSLQLENIEDFELADIRITDDLPTGFRLVTDSVKFIRAGADGIIETADDQAELMTPLGTDPVNFGHINLAAKESAIIRYYARVATGVLPGNYTNTAQALTPDNQFASHVATSTVEVIQDPILEKTTIIGKVFHDRDGDGYQDNADSSDIRIRSAHFGWEKGHSLGNLTGKARPTSSVEDHQLQISMPYDRETARAFSVTSAEGTVINVASDGRVNYAHQGLKHRGMSGQELHVRVEERPGATELIITISNQGVHEEGMPGVRLATVAGLLIETDQYGRFHIADVDIGDTNRGRNYIVKVDSATLPEGSTFTTENPRVLRLSQALMTRFNFGVKLPQHPVVSTSSPAVSAKAENNVVIDTSVTKTLKDIIEPVRFSTGQSQISADYLERLQTVISHLGDRENLRLRIIGHTDDQRLSRRTAAQYGDNQGLSVARAEQVAEIILKRLQLSPEQMIVTGQGDTHPVTSNETVDGRALNRRVEIEVIYDEIVQEEIREIPDFQDRSPERKIALPQGGMIWATEDPARFDPRLSVKAGSVIKLKGRKPLAPIKFRLYSNYAAFIDNWELLIFAEDDLDLLKPLTRLSGRELRYDQPVIWNGYLNDGKRLPAAGEHLRYILRVHDEHGFYDETAPQLLRVVETSMFGDSYTPKAQLLAEEKLSTTVSNDQNHLVRQTIPLTGSRVRIYGADINRKQKISINGEKLRIDERNKFVWEQQYPLGQHEFVIRVDDGSETGWERQIQMDVDGQYFFMVGLANLTTGKNDIDGHVETITGDESFDNDVWVDGRLGFYLKGKIKGKYLLTAQLDTQEDEISQLGDNLKRKDPRAIFRKLDADQYYPVYGDDSTNVSDVDTQGAFYVRLDWSKSRLLWGNYNTALTGNEFAQYNRSLYGAQYIHKGLAVTRHGDHRTELYAFASEAQTAQAHNEFIATGGSLYYLRETDIVRGSEKVWVEVRARDSQRVVSNATLIEGRDYQIDYLQGRLILSQPLAQYAAQNMTSIINDQPQEGDDVVLLVDYEYVPAGFSGEELSAGLRGKGWLTDAVALGATYVEEARENAADYRLSGVDLTYKHGRNSWIRAEYAESEYSQNDGWISNNGGLSFAGIRNPLNHQEQGNAYGVTGQVNLAEMTDAALQGRITAWWKSRQAGFSSTRVNDGIETMDTGLEVNWDAAEDLRIQGRFGELEQDNITSRSLNLQARVKTNEWLTLIGETRREETDSENEQLGFTDKGDATLAALGAEFRIRAQTTLYGSLQTVVENSGTYTDNEAVTLGARTQLTDNLAFKGEYTEGDRGRALLLGLAHKKKTRITAEVETGVGHTMSSQVGTSYKGANGTELYGNYIVENDRIDQSTRTTTLGQRKRMSNDTRIFTEQQFNENMTEAGITHLFGMDHNLNREFKLNLSLAHSDVDSIGNGKIYRDTMTTGLSFNDKIRIKASTRLEYRKDDGMDRVTQWLTTNTLDWKQNLNLRWLIKLNLALTENELMNTTDGKFIEANLGFAYRPASQDRFNFLGKYSYLYDLPAQLTGSSLVGQNSFSADEKAHIVSFETLYDLDKRWELGGKLAWRGGETRTSRAEGEWFESGARLAALRTRYHFVDQWDAMAEYHLLQAESGDDRRDGALLGFYHHINSHFKAGVGYNFTDFSDNLAQINDYNSEGWFFDFTGKF